MQHNVARVGIEYAVKLNSQRKKYLPNDATAVNDIENV